MRMTRQQNRSHKNRIQTSKSLKSVFRIKNLQIFQADSHGGGRSRVHNSGSGLRLNHRSHVAVIAPTSAKTVGVGMNHLARINMKPPVYRRLAGWQRRFNPWYPVCACVCTPSVCVGGGAIGPLRHRGPTFNSSPFLCVKKKPNMQTRELVCS